MESSSSSDDDSVSSRSSGTLAEDEPNQPWSIRNRHFEVYPDVRGSTSNSNTSDQHNQEREMVESVQNAATRNKQINTSRKIRLRKKSEQKLAKKRNVHHAVNELGARNSLEGCSRQLTVGKKRTRNEVDTDDLRVERSTKSLKATSETSSKTKSQVPAEEPCMPSDEWIANLIAEEMYPSPTTSNSDLSDSDDSGLHKIIIWGNRREEQVERNVSPDIRNNSPVCAELPTLPNEPNQPWSIRNRHFEVYPDVRGSNVRASTSNYNTSDQHNQEREMVESIQNAANSLGGCSRQLTRRKKRTRNEVDTDDLPVERSTKSLKASSKTSSTTKPQVPAEEPCEPNQPWSIRNRHFEVYPDVRGSNVRASTSNYNTSDQHNQEREMVESIQNAANSLGGCSRQLTRRKKRTRNEVDTDDLPVERSTKSLKASSKTSSTTKPQVPAEEPCEPNQPWSIRNRHFEVYPDVRDSNVRASTSNYNMSDQHNQEREMVESIQNAANSLGGCSRQLTRRKKRTRNEVDTDDLPVERSTKSLKASSKTSSTTKPQVPAEEPCMPSDEWIARLISEEMYPCPSTASDSDLSGSDDSGLHKIIIWGNRRKEQVERNVSPDLRNNSPVCEELPKKRNVPCNELDKLADTRPKKKPKLRRSIRDAHFDSSRNLSGTTSKHIARVNSNRSGLPIVPKDSVSQNTRSKLRNQERVIVESIENAPDNVQVVENVFCNENNAEVCEESTSRNILLRKKSEQERLNKQNMPLQLPAQEIAELDKLADTRPKKKPKLRRSIRDAHFDSSRNLSGTTSKHIARVNSNRSGLPIVPKDSVSQNTRSKLRNQERVIVESIENAPDNVQVVENVFCNENNAEVCEESTSRNILLRKKSEQERLNKQNMPLQLPAQEIAELDKLADTRPKKKPKLRRSIRDAHFDSSRNLSGTTSKHIARVNSNRSGLPIVPKDSVSQNTRSKLRNQERVIVESIENAPDNVQVVENVFCNENNAEVCEESTSRNILLRKKSEQERLNKQNMPLQLPAQEIATGATTKKQTRKNKKAEMTTEAQKTGLRRSTRDRKPAPIRATAIMYVDEKGRIILTK